MKGDRKFHMDESERGGKGTDSSVGRSRSVKTKIELVCGEIEKPK